MGKNNGEKYIMEKEQDAEIPGEETAREQTVSV